MVRNPTEDSRGLESPNLTQLTVLRILRYGQELKTYQGMRS